MTASPSDHNAEERQILVEILQQRGPQIGARLKVLLIGELGRRRKLPVPQWNGLIPKLSTFLAKHSDLVEVDRGLNDINVCLRSPGSISSSPSPAPAPVWYRPDVWHAFLNPDPLRRRYFSRTTHEVVHYVPGSNESPNPEIARRVTEDQNFVEIIFAPAARQSDWMREFLETTALLPEASKKIARHFLTVPYETAVNSAFAAALGQYADAWKKYRAAKVDEQIQKWARTNGIDTSELQKAPEPPRALEQRSEVIAPALVTQTIGPNSDDDLRAALRTLVDQMDDNELRLVQIPATALLKRRPIA